MYHILLMTQANLRFIIVETSSQYTNYGLLRQNAARVHTASRRLWSHK
jgi:hypothetical protein